TEERNYLFVKAQNWWSSVDAFYYTHALSLIQEAASLEKDSGDNTQHITSTLSLALMQLDKAQSLNPYRPQAIFIRGLLYQQYPQPEWSKSQHFQIVTRQFSDALLANPFYLDARIALARHLLS